MASTHLSPSRRIMYEELHRSPGKWYKRVGPDTERLAEQHGLSVETFAQALVDLARQRLISKERVGHEVFYFFPEEAERQASRDAAHDFTVIYARYEDDHVIASVPALPGCHSQGRTVEEAKHNVSEAARGYVASLAHRGEPVPEEIGSGRIAI